MAAKSHSHIWNSIGPKFGENVEGAQIHIHTRLEYSRSNRNKIRQIRNFYELWPLWPWKVGQIQNPGNMWCSLIRYTSHNEMAHGPCAHRCGVSEEGKLLQHCSILSCCVGWGQKTKERFFVLLRLIEMKLRSEYWRCVLISQTQSLGDV
jgi:hypothetical protein